MISNVMVKMYPNIKKTFVILMLFVLALSAFSYDTSEDFFKDASFDKTIHFNALLFKDEEIQEENLEYLEEIVEKIKMYLSENKNIGITIVGQTSSFLDKIYTIGNNEIKNTNLDKSKIYSNKIKEYFIKNGVDPSVIFTEVRLTNKDNLSNSVSITMYVKGNLDKDNDGVENRLDKCPNTKKGYKVGPDGCKLKTIVMLLKGKKENSSIIVNTKGGSVIIDKVNQFVSIGSSSLPPTKPMDIGKDSSFISIPSVDEEELRYVFYFKDNDIVEESSQRIEEMLKELNNRKNAYIKIIGHTDTVGTFKQNSIIAKVRAENIAKVIIDSNIKYMKMDIESYSETNLAVPTKDNVYEPLNRRVEVFIN